MRKIYTVLVFILVAASVALASCVEPLELDPDIVGEIVALEVEGQTRVPTVNTSARTVNIEVGREVDLDAVRITRIELNPTASCDLAAGSTLDLRTPLRVTVTTVAGYEWTITGTQRPIDPVAQRPLPDGGFENWHRTDRISAGGAVNPEGKVWNPWIEGGVLGDTRWWDTGNDGVTMLGNSISTPTAPGEGCPANPEGIAARLETVFAVLKVAGGNIYFGRFGGLEGMDAKCEMGHPWQAKPRGLKGWYKYFPQPIDKTLASHVGLHPYGLSRDEWMGKMDSLHVSVALWASPDGEDKPFVVDTNYNRFTDLTRGSEGVIAWGSFVSGEEQAEWSQFSLTLDYLRPEYLGDTPLPPNTRLVVQATASKHCNYFIAGTSGGGPDGKTGSLMYVDEFELVY